MNILFAIDSLSGGGAEKLISDISPYFNEKYHCEILLLSDTNDKYSKKLKEKGIVINVIPKGNLFFKIKYIIKYVKEKNFDIIHANLFPIIYYCSIAKKIMGKKSPVLVMTEHNTFNRRRKKRIFRYIEKFIYSSYDCVISISNETNESLLKWINPKDKSKYFIVNNGIPLEKFYNAIPYEKKELITSYQKDDILICQVGSLTEQKGHEFMLDVMKSLPDNYHLICVGEGPLKEKIIDKINLLNLNNRVHLLGYRTDVERIIKTCDIFVIPSKWEGFGLVAAEALACERRIIASDVPGLSNVVGNLGKKVKYGDVEAFSNEILNYKSINTNRTLEESKKYDINKMINEYEKLFLSLIKSR